MQSTVSIPGIHCASCAELIKDVTSDFPEITNVDVDVEAKNVKLEYPDSFDLDNWKREVEALGETYTIASIS